MIFHCNDATEYELLRFCNKKNIRVVGGAGKLFQHFIKIHKPHSVISYANYDISSGNLYKKIGFTQTDKIYPSYWWCKDGKKYHRSKFMKHLIVSSDDDKIKTAPQIMKERGYYRTWNSGNLKFSWKSEQ